MMDDFYEYEDSIFYQGWIDVKYYTDRDKAVISILDDTRIEPGMTVKEVEDLLHAD